MLQGDSTIKCLHEAMKVVDNCEKFKAILEQSSELELEVEREEDSWFEEACEWSESKEYYGWSDYEE